MVISVFVDPPDLSQTPVLILFPPGSAAIGSAATLTPGRFARREPKGARTWKSRDPASRD